VRYRTFPHDAIKEKCEEKYRNRWAVLECITNSLMLYYGKISEEELLKRKEKYVKISH